MVGEIVFGVIALIAIISAAGMLSSKNGIHAAMFLVLNFVTIALFYIGLAAPFLAMVQVTVYAGAIMVLFIFVIMLLGADKATMDESELPWQTTSGIILFGLLIMVAAAVFLQPAVQSSLGVPPEIADSVANAVDQADAFGSPQAVGVSLFIDFMLPFQIVGLLLLVGMVGAVVLAHEERKKSTGAEVRRRRYVDPATLGRSDFSVSPEREREEEAVPSK